MELLLRGARVIDGTGAPAINADVLVRDGRIVAVGQGLSAPDAEIVDLTGLVLAPGFIDIHTHYDAQVLWDHDLTPSCWHGVTTVLMGNCGFGIAPTRPEHRELIARTLENVEGMSAEALAAGIPWTFETFPQYLDTLEGAPTRLNVMAMIGHTPLRLYVVGNEEREATFDEIARMRALVAEAMDAGAAGFASSRSPTHSGAAGRPVPSRFAVLDEMAALAGAVGEAGFGIVQVTRGPDLSVEDLAGLSEQLKRPITWTPLFSATGPPGSAVAQADESAAAAGNVWAQTSCRPLVMQLSLADPFPLATTAPFREILAVPVPERARLYADPQWRQRAREALEGGWNTRLAKTFVDETVAHADLRGRSLPDLAAERGCALIDVMIDLSLAEELHTRFLVMLANDDEVELAQLLTHPRVLVGLSDAGAHASQLCDAGFSTYLLGHWVRETGLLELEDAVHRLTGQPAGFLGLTDRGRIAAGWAADLVAFDPETVSALPPERVFDLPAGADRLIAHSAGIIHVWVNGEQIRCDGKDVVARPGVLVRFGAAAKDAS